jgi:hypothetical protein
LLGDALQVPHVKTGWFIIFHVTVSASRALPLRALSNIQANATAPFQAETFQSPESLTAFRQRLIPSVRTSYASRRFSVLRCCSLHVLVQGCGSSSFLWPFDFKQCAIFNCLEECPQSIAVDAFDADSLCAEACVGDGCAFVGT